MSSGIDPLNQSSTRLRQRKRVSLDFSDVVSLTKQSEKDSCDLNKIIANYQRLGVDFGYGISAVSPEIVDFSNVGDFQAMMELQAQVKSVFDMLPASVRYRFNNDVSAFAHFASNPANVDQLVDLGVPGFEKSPVSPVFDSEVSPPNVEN